eukprot:scaffold43556_cov68-Phaeocystis_antarctica.AAC.5
MAVLVLAELGAALQYDLLELVGQVGRHEGLDRFSVPDSAVCPAESMTGRRCSGFALDLGQHLGPRGRPLDEVARVLLVQPVAVGDTDELVVAHAALVGEERKLRVALLVVLADDLRVV